MTHILCLVDGSDPACRAARTAAGLAVALNADLTYLAFAKAGQGDAAFDNYRRAEGLQGEVPALLPSPAETCLAIALHDAAAAGRGHSHRLVRIGTPATGIRAAIAEVGADTIVLGRRAKGRFHRFNPLAVAQAVMANTDATIVLVK